MAITDNTQEAANRRRTYRGRTLEEILPKIREELGADAVILREREGLHGGVGGFFAQRVIEVEARRGDGQSIDIYDEEPEGERPGVPAQPEAETALPAETAPAADAGKESQPARRFETDLFMERLREASAVWAEDDADEAPTLPPERISPPPAPAPRPEPKPRADREKPAAKPRPGTRDNPVAGDAAERPRPGAKATPRPRSGPKPARPGPTPRPRPERRRPDREPPTEPAAELKTEPMLTPAAPAVLEAAVPPEPVAVPPQPAARTAPEPTPVPVAQPTAQIVPAPATPAPAVPVSPASGPETSAAKLVPVSRTGQQEGLMTSLSRMVAGRRRGVHRSPAPRPADARAIAGVLRDLSGRGASQAFATNLIAVASAHGVMMQGDLRAAAEAELTRRIIPAPPLPAGGAAIAFIGAGGSGKTACTAALASAYRRSSTLPVSVLSLESPDRGRELRKLLRSEGVPVVAASVEHAVRAIAKAREGGVVIVDTPATTPTDRQAVAALGRKLGDLALDAVYVTLPATLGSQAARLALGSFGSLAPSAVAITHADETDQLAVSVELAISHRIPLAYLHAGADYRSALSPVDPATIARTLLP